MLAEPDERVTVNRRAGEITISFGGDTNVVAPRHSRLKEARLMPALQLDLFAGSGKRPDQTAAPTAGRPRRTALELEDDALIAAIPHASVVDCRSLAAEAGRRQLVGAVLALEALCRRFRGFGLEHPVPEQTAALEALAEIGGGEAAGAVRRIIVEKIVQGSGLENALRAAARLGVGLPVKVIVSLLQHEAPEIRAGGCRYARSPAVIPLLLELLNDPDHAGAREAACALGRMGRSDARPMTPDQCCCGCSNNRPPLR